MPSLPDDNERLAQAEARAVWIVRVGGVDESNGNPNGGRFAKRGQVVALQPPDQAERRCGELPVLHGELELLGGSEDYVFCRIQLQTSGMGFFALPSFFFKNVQCVRETDVLVEHQPPQGVFVCDHACLVIHYQMVRQSQLVGNGACLKLTTLDPTGLALTTAKIPLPLLSPPCSSRFHPDEYS